MLRGDSAAMGLARGAALPGETVPIGGRARPGTARHSLYHDLFAREVGRF